MRVRGKEVGPQLWIAALAGALLLPSAARAEGGQAPQGGKAPAGAEAPKDAGKKAAEGQPGGAKPGDAKAAPKAADAKPAVEKAPAGPPKPGLWASLDDFMNRTGRKLEEKRFLGMRVRPTFSESLSYTDNAFYQNSDEELVVNYNPDIFSANNGIDDDNDGDTDERDERILFNGIDDDNSDLDGNPLTGADEKGERFRARRLGRSNPRLDEPRGEVSEIVNTASLSVGLEMALNPEIVPAIGHKKNTFDLVRGTFTSVEYLRHGDSPDAWNWQVTIDFPHLLSLPLARLQNLSGGKNTVYYRVEADLIRVTDPLDVQSLVYGPVPGSGKSVKGLFRNGNRNDFMRQEWWVKGTVGWKGPRMDALVSYKHLDFDLLDDETLSSADHQEQTAYGEAGYTLNRHRAYGFYEYTNFAFTDRRGPASGNVPSLRDFSRTRTGLGLSGPVATEKLKGRVELYFLATDVFHEGGFQALPYATVLENGQAVPGPLVSSHLVRRPFDERNGFGASASATYAPFKATQITADYANSIEWSVVAQNKKVDRGSLAFIHNLNERLTFLMKYSVNFENVVFRERRFYQEFGSGFRYKILKYTDLDLQYTARYMRSRHSPTTVFADPANNPYWIRPDGDFFANIVSVGLTVSF